MAEPNGGFNQHDLFEAMPEDEPEAIAPERSHNGYTPGQFWYWESGGEPVPPEEIPPVQFRYDPINRNHHGKPSPSLEQQLATARSELELDIARYVDLLERGDAACSSYDLMFGYNSRFNCSLKYNHISYRKGVIRALERAIARFGF